MHSRFLANRRRLFSSHPRLMSALLFGTISAVLLPNQWAPELKILVGWDIAVWTYLGLMAWLMVHSDNHRMHRLARQEDNNAVFVLAVMSVGAILSLAAIIIELASAKNTAGAAKLLHYGLTDRKSTRLTPVTQ